MPKLHGYHGVLIAYAEAHRGRLCTFTTFKSFKASICSAETVVLLSTINLFSMLFLYFYQPYSTEAASKWDSSTTRSGVKEGEWFPLVPCKVLLGLGSFIYLLSSALTDAAKSLSNLLAGDSLQPYLQKCAAERLNICVAVECSHTERSRSSNSRGHNSGGSSSRKVVTFKAECPYTYGQCDSQGPPTVDRKNFSVVVLHSRIVPVAAHDSPNILANIGKMKEEAFQMCRHMDTKCETEVLYSLEGMKPLQLVEYEKSVFFTKCTYFLFAICGMSYLYNVLFTVLSGSLLVDFRKTIHEGEGGPPNFTMPQQNAAFGNPEAMKAIMDLARRDPLAAMRAANEQQMVQRGKEAATVSL